MTRDAAIKKAQEYAAAVWRGETSAPIELVISDIVWSDLSAVNLTNEEDDD
jgi:hypothetical protein